MDAVKVRTKNNNLSLILSSFDLSIILKKGTTFNETINVRKRLAPELESGQTSDMAADVWALGQIAFQLLCCPKKEKLLACEDSSIVTSQNIEVQL